MANFNVSNSSQLMSALSSAKAGDTILLADGNYGNVDLSEYQFNDYVTITSANGDKGAIFDEIELEDASYLRFDNISVESGGARAGIWVADSHHIEILNSEISGPVSYPVSGVGFGIEVRDGSHNIKIAYNDIHHVKNGMVNFGTEDFEIIGNNVNHVGADAFKFAGVDGGLIKNNMGPTEFHPTGIQ